MEKDVSGKSVFLSFFWVIFEKFGYSGLRLISLFVLARLLTPEDFGLIGAVAIVIELSKMIVEAGFGAALINKEEVDEIDFNTVFTFNLLVSLLLISTLFFLAPSLGAYFGAPVLKNVIRVLSLTLLFNSVTIVQRTILVKQLFFRKQAYITLFSLLLSIVLAIFAAVEGFGVWALVLQQVSYSLFFSIIVVLVVRYKPKLYLSRKAFRELLSFGGRVALSSALQRTYDTIISSVIAKVYSIELTGLYSQSQRLTEFPVNIFRSLYGVAAFPILSKVKNSPKEFVRICSKINRGVYLLAFPLLLVIPFNSELLILMALGEQWVEAKSILSILSIGVIFLLPNISAFNILKSLGEGKRYLRIGIQRTILGFLILGITTFVSLEAILYGIIFTYLITTIMIMKEVSRLTAYSFKRQLKDVLIPLFLALIANALTIAIFYLFSESTGFEKLIFYLLMMITFFILECWVFSVEEVKMVVDLLKKKRWKN